MKHLIIVFIIVLWILPYPSPCARMLFESSVTESSVNESSVVIEAHKAWMIKYGIHYANRSEMEKRLQIFKKELEYIEKFNKAGKKSYTVGLNQYSDLTTEEFIASHTGVKASDQAIFSKARSNPVILNITDDELPTSFDWREKGAVTDVKQQGGCGACWAFAAVAAVEGFWSIQRGRLLDLSEQQVIDCDKGSHGCIDGSIVSGLNSIILSDGIREEFQYPYQEANGTCKNDEEFETEAFTGCYKILEPNNELNLLRVVTQQPVAVNVATGDEFRKYTGGVFLGTCGTDINHSVVIVGFGEENGAKYWLIKNSWSKNWGENGYMRILRQGDGPEGHCRIASEAAIPCFGL